MLKINVKNRQDLDPMSLHFLVTEKEWKTLKAVGTQRTANNSVSTKLLTYLDNAAESLHIGNISLAELNINEARKQLRASGA